jgi:hypothetical protein
MGKVLDEFGLMRLLKKRMESKQIKIVIKNIKSFYV